MTFKHTWSLKALNFYFILNNEFNESKWRISKEALSETIFCVIYSNTFNPKFEWQDKGEKRILGEIVWKVWRFW